LGERQSLDSFFGLADEIISNINNEIAPEKNTSLNKSFVNGLAEMSETLEDLRK
jgi:hypothetical protein